MLQLVGLVILIGLLLPLSAYGQIDAVAITVENDFIGLQGHVRQGQWAPVRLSLRSRLAEPRDVVCRWVLSDFDGDEVIAQRRVTLNPGELQHVWLYAALPVNERRGTPWRFHVFDEADERLLARRQILPRDYLEWNESAIGILGVAEMGLRPYTESYTQHEPINMVRGLSLPTLPDRWYGLSPLAAMIWTRDGGEPTAMSFDVQQALRQWLQRGGHLVISLPAVGETWTASALADLLPVRAEQMMPLRDRPPNWLADALPEHAESIRMTAFDLPEDVPGTAVLLRDRHGAPLVVSQRHGLGRVTLIGVDLTDPQATPAGRFRIWNHVFHWQTPAFSETYIEAELNARPARMSQPRNRSPIELGRFIPAQIAMHQTAAPALLLAVLVFGLYWLLAGPVSFLVLKQRGVLRHSWLAFVAVVAVFSVVAWGGAWMMQDREMSLSHFSVVDIDGQTGLSRTQSWLSLHLPHFGRAEVTLGDPDSTSSAYQTLSSAGLPTDVQAAGFLETLSYTINASHPAAANVPARATAKQFELDFLGRLDRQPAGLVGSWVAPQGEVRLGENYWPTGQLSHGLPSDLHNVLIVYCPGNGQMPWVWRHGARGDWPAQSVMQLGRPAAADRLVKRPVDYDGERRWANEGWLGSLIERKTGQGFAAADPLQIAPADNVVAQAVEMLTFYAAMPPPDFRRIDFTRSAVTYQRALGRSLDLTHLTDARRLIILGHLHDSPLPAPLTVDGEPVNATGWTVVRWVYDF